VFFHQRREDPDQFVALFDHGILDGRQIAGFPAYAKAIARFFEFAETDLALRELVAAARAVRMRVGLRVGGRQGNGKRVKVEFYSR